MLSEILILYHCENCVTGQELAHPVSLYETKLLLRSQLDGHEISLLLWSLKVHMSTPLDSGINSEVL
jgi:hypothetical protein